MSLVVLVLLFGTPAIAITITLIIEIHFDLFSPVQISNETRISVAVKGVLILRRSRYDLVWTRFGHTYDYIGFRK